MRKNLLLFGIFLVFYGCTPTVKNQKDTLAYFDLKGYFKQEALRLTKSNPLITKTVEVNSTAETKKIRIVDWTKEFAVFSDADINRNAWKGLFSTHTEGQQQQYRSDQEKIPVKEVLVTKKNGQVSGIRILIRYSNMLYTSADTLSYYPDSLYQINKKQHIKLMAEKSYRITGRLK